MNSITIKEQEYRIKKMNAIELLALRTQISFDTLDTATKLYSTVLERIEVKAGDKWLQVKQTNKDIYFPAGIEDDIETIEALLDYALSYFQSVFRKSNASNQLQE